MILIEEIKLTNEDARKIVNSKPAISAEELAARTNRFANITDYSQVVRPWEKNEVKQPQF